MVGPRPPRRHVTADMIVIESCVLSPSESLVFTDGKPLGLGAVVIQGAGAGHKLKCVMGLTFHYAFHLPFPVRDILLGKDFPKDVSLCFHFPIRVLPVFFFPSSIKLCLFYPGNISGCS